MQQALVARSITPATVAQYVAQLQQYATFRTHARVPLWTEHSGCMWVLHAVEVMGHKKATCKQKITAIERGGKVFRCHMLDDRGWSTPLLLLQRAITLADDWERKIQVGWVELGRLKEH
jgi:hypothetical protein